MPLIDQDQEHLRLLSFAYYFQAGMTAFFGLFGILYAVLGLFVALVPRSTTTQDDPRMAGYIFGAIGIAFVLFAALITTTEFLVARYLKRREHHTFCLVIAGLNCLWIPIGTALGVCTFLVLQRPAGASADPIDLGPRALSLNHLGAKLKSPTVSIDSASGVG